MVTTASTLHQSINQSFGDVMNNSSIHNVTTEYIESECSFVTLLEVFHQYYIPFIIFVGLIGNSLSCVVFLTTHLKIRSSSYYLAALALADLGFLTMLFLVYFQYHNRQVLCQIVIYISSVCAMLSVWLIAAFTTERFIAVHYPLQRPQMCTVSRAKTIVLSILVVALVTQSYSFVTAGMKKFNDDDDEICEILDDHRQAMEVINSIDTILSLIVPFFLIVVMNTMIARNLFMFRRRFQHSTFSECQSSYRSDLHQIQCNTESSRRPTSQNSHNSMSRLATSRRSKSSDNSSRCIHSERHFVTMRNQENITKMLLLISSVFTLLNLPSYVIRIYVFLGVSLLKQHQPFQLWCLQQLFMLLYYTHFSINFLLYAMSGITFRRCLWKLIRKITKAIRKFCATLRFA